MFSVIRRSWLLPGLALTLAACAPRPFADKPVAVPMTVAFDLPRAEVADAFRRYATEAGMVVDASGDDSVVVARGRNAAGSLMASLGQDAAAGTVDQVSAAATPFSFVPKVLRDLAAVAERVPASLDGRRGRAGCSRSV
jgi:hypothetical protein